MRQLAQRHADAGDGEPAEVGAGARQRLHQLLEKAAILRVHAKLAQMDFERGQLANEGGARRAVPVGELETVREANAQGAQFVGRWREFAAAVVAVAVVNVVVVVRQQPLRHSADVEVYRVERLQLREVNLRQLRPAVLVVVVSGRLAVARCVRQQRHAAKCWSGGRRQALGEEVGQAAVVVSAAVSKQVKKH